MDGVLALQRMAGNRAVRSLVAREPAPQAPEQTKSHVVVSGLGTIELESFSWGGSVNDDYGSGRKDVVLQTLTGKHSAKLTEAAAKGKPFKSVEIVWVGGGGTTVRITLKEALVSSYQVGGSESGNAPQEMWSLNYREIDVKYETAP
jgi:type VI protein secretion system component Hcp